MTQEHENQNPEQVSDATATLNAEQAPLTLTEQDIDKLRMEQNLPMGIVMSLLAALVGAVIWAAITVSTGYQIGYMAVGVGALVGLCMRFFGKGIDPIFSYFGAGISLLGCVLGNFFGLIALISREIGLTYSQIILEGDWAVIMELFGESFQGMDVLFYGIAVYEGFRFSIRTISAEDIQRIR